MGIFDKMFKKRVLTTLQGFYVGERKIFGFWILDSMFFTRYEAIEWLHR